MSLTLKTAAMSNEEKIVKLEYMLKTHDWSYQYSDDMGRWRDGASQWTAIRDLMEELGDTQEIKDMYTSYQPEYLRV